MRYLTKVGQGTLKSYTTGFILSVILTFTAYFAVAEHWLSGAGIAAYIVALAILQLGVQLYFFLHLGHEAKPRWNLLVFGFMALVVSIIVGGSLWILHNLDYHTMPAHDTDQAIIKDEGIPR